MAPFSAKARDFLSASRPVHTLTQPPSYSISTRDHYLERMADTVPRLIGPIPPLPNTPSLCYRDKFTLLKHLYFPYHEGGRKDVAAQHECWKNGVTGGTENGMGKKNVERQTDRQTEDEFARTHNTLRSMHGDCAVTSTARQVFLP
jgi:hypothetical protein